MNSGIYLIANIVNGKVYVGSSTHINTRKRQHFSELKRGEHGNPHLQYAWNKHDQEAFCFQILEHCDIEDLVEREDWWITLLDSRNPDKGYNLRSADRRVGHKHSDESREKMSTLAKRRGNNGASKNGLSAETKAKIGNIHRGKPKSEQQVENLRSINRGNTYRLGKTQSEEAKAKISSNNGSRRPEVRAKMCAAHKGKPWTQERKDAYRQSKRYSRSETTVSQ